MNIFELIEIKKLLSMIFALGAIQLVGGLMSRFVGVHAGFLISGFVNGFISSTAFTANLAKKSKSMTTDQVGIESISFLSATLAMLIQGMFLVLIGMGPVLSVLVIFICPILMTLILIIIRHQKIKSIEAEFPKAPLIDIISLLKLTVFIIGIIALSKFMQIQFGGRGLEVLTFLVSLFEIHGSIIANTQLLVKESISLNDFYTLLSLSISASYVSKVFMILFLGHPFLKRRVLLWTSFIWVSILMSWVLMKFVF